MSDAHFIAGDWGTSRLRLFLCDRAGSILDRAEGPGIELELWSLPAAAFGQFVARIPAPLGIGKIRLDDGGDVSGFLCEAHAIAGAEEITRLGGWRAYIKSLSL